MIYLVSKFHCLMFGESKIEILPDVKYKVIDSVNQNCVFLGYRNESPIIINFANPDCNTKSIVHIREGVDDYFFLMPHYSTNGFYTTFKYGNKDVQLNLSEDLMILVGGEIVLQTRVEEIMFSHYELVGDLCVIYFSGAREYVVILNGAEVCCADYYDEINVADNETLFMCRKHDVLNHGRVYQIKDKKFDTYLVYLDEEELKLKDEFVACTFLDCLLNKNFKYCNSLLDDNIKQENENSIMDFFDEFDDYYPVSENKVFLFKKNTLAGIYNFEINSHKISNIISL